ncbi:Ankyrin-3 [Colletotrichum sp. SAR 10_70]|nr:Ankyrin-3 [Colletotrichum sp. SAR 10_71]KAI8173505.1 Ankyrin-3 [Colletotrichum sp. SAR 10_70]
MLNRTQIATQRWVKLRQQIRRKEPGQQDRSQEVQGQDIYWLLIRVNQLWVWTIDDRWLISASSHPIDDREDEVLNGILDLLQEQGEDGVSDLQPGSVTEMSQLIVDHCVGFYERTPRKYDDERPEDRKLESFPSIRQTYSRFINSLARNEVDLFEYLSNLTKKLRIKQSSKSTESYNDATVVNDEKLTAIANHKVDKLYSDVKVVLDELGILKATVHYQQDVQRSMRMNINRNDSGFQDISETDVSATYIIDEIQWLSNIAERVLTSASTKVSFYQSEIANIQAEIATRQGEILMVFTVITIVFVPLSFMTSLFAVDVASFQQAPAWALIFR